MLLNISTLTPVTQRYVGSGQNGEVELHRQTPIPVVALIKIIQPSLQGVTSCSTLTSTACVL